MPLANHYSLEVFFWEGRPPLNESGEYARKYAFGDKFPGIKTDADLHKAVVKQVYQLADGLLWLHQGLGDFEKPNSYLAHMDLKPDNILIHGNPQDKGTPVGTWMITDFGISAFYKKSHEPIRDMPTIRNLTSQLTSLSVRGRGSYQPPEIGLERKNEELRPALHSRYMLDYRQCDVWSFGCVSLDALAFALNRRQGIQEIREVRTQDGNNSLYKFVKSVEAIDSISASNTELKEKFVNWGKKIRKSNAEPWVQGYLDILFHDSIVPCPADRKCIGDIKSSLGDLHPKLNSATNPKKLTDHGGFDNTQIKDSQNKPFHKNNDMEGLPDVGEYQSLENGITGGSSSISLHSPNVAVHHWQPQKGNLGNGVVGGSPSVLVHSPNVADNRQQHQIEDKHPYSRIPVPLDKAASVKAVALDSTGEWIAIIAILGEAKIYVFPTRQLEPSGQKPLTISAKVRWNNVRIAHPGLAIFGAKPSGEIVVSYATFAASDITVPPLSPASLQNTEG